MFYPGKRYSYSDGRDDYSENLITAEARVADEPETKRGVDGESLKILFQAFVDNFIYRPMRSLGNFFIVTKSILYDPSVGIEEKYLIS